MISWFCYSFVCFGVVLDVSESIFVFSFVFSAYPTFWSKPELDKEFSFHRKVSRTIIVMVCDFDGEKFLRWDEKFCGEENAPLRTVGKKVGKNTVKTRNFDKNHKVTVWFGPFLLNFVFYVFYLWTFTLLWDIFPKIDTFAPQNVLHVKSYQNNQKQQKSKSKVNK